MVAIIVVTITAISMVTVTVATAGVDPGHARPVRGGCILPRTSPSSLLPLLAVVGGECVAPLLDALGHGVQSASASISASGSSLPKSIATWPGTAWNLPGGGDGTEYGASGLSGSSGLIFGRGVSLCLLMLNHSSGSVVWL
jgi:hypothetical protein